jgi:hypothetical protein
MSTESWPLLFRHAALPTVAVERNADGGRVDSHRELNTLVDAVHRAISVIGFLSLA